ncbi:MAG TPA: PqqD family protein [Verrucomicrobiae bacterium]|nr:PqqD family protein [Verrucomicrobiae bacterium]
MAGDNLFELYPLRRKEILWEESAPGVLTLIFPRAGLLDKLLHRLFKTPTLIKVDLDEMGSLVWRLSDGKNQVYQIARAMGENFGTLSEPVNERLITFLRILKNNGWIKLARKKDRA